MEYPLLFLKPTARVEDCSTVVELRIVCSEVCSEQNKYQRLYWRERIVIPRKWDMELVKGPGSEVTVVQCCFETDRPENLYEGP